MTPAGIRSARWLPVLLAFAEYLLGFFAIAIFAAYAFAHGKPAEDRWQRAFLLGAALAVIEVGLLLRRRAPANRLILCLNAWLVAGGVAVLLQQWWWLRWYERVGEASMFLTMLAGGLAFTLCSPHGFVGTAGDVRVVRRASWLLMTGALVALGVSLAWRGDTRYAAVLPVIGLSWLNRLLQRWVGVSSRRAVAAPADSLAAGAGSSAMTTDN